MTGAKVAADAITADKIADGQVVEGAGALLSNRLTLPVGAGSQLLDVAGFGSLSASCSTGAGDAADHERHRRDGERGDTDARTR